ncbi:MAG TPA: PaaI family thioesterase [Xanthobacteraceae bacterium]|jgi:uncharacterized protein (TIGR00369 family)
MSGSGQAPKGPDKDAFFWQIREGRRSPPPSAKTLGLRFVAVNTEAGTLEAEFEGREEFLNPAGVIQGGFLAAMLDDTMGPTVSAMLAAGEFAPTLNLNVQFHRPARVGKLKGIGRVVMRGSGVCFLSGELYQDGKLVASATATAAIRKLG